MYVCAYHIFMRYEWDEAKREANIIKHGIDFVEVAGLIVWSFAATKRDERSNYGEPRFVSLVPIRKRLHVVVWTPRKKVLRIIGIRKANKREEQYYEEIKEA